MFCASMSFPMFFPHKCCFTLFTIEWSHILLVFHFMSGINIGVYSIFIVYLNKRESNFHVFFWRAPLEPPSEARHTTYSTTTSAVLGVQQVVQAGILVIQQSYSILQTIVNNTYLAICYSQILWRIEYISRGNLPVHCPC